MLCPICEQEMFDNRANKKNPKAPDYRCKDKNCKYSFNVSTGEYEPGEYTTAIWLAKHTQPEKPNPIHTAQSSQKDTQAVSFAQAYSKDLIVSAINNQVFSGWEWEKIVEEWESLYNKMIEKY